MRFPKITSLYGRIFAIFWFTMFLVLMAVLSLQYFDPRKVSDVPEPHYDRLLSARDKIQSHFAGHTDIQSIIADLYRSASFQERRSDHRGGDNDFEIFITDQDGNLITAHDKRYSNVRALRNFVTNIDNTDTPKQRLYGKFMFAGPVPIRLADNDYLFYLSVKWNRPPSFLIQLFDHPFQLLLATMLISTPLLLWLAWALSQPARRLEKAAQRVARGEFSIDPELEKGTSEFSQAGASFNQMVEAVNQMILRQQRLLSDISHELRSPLTRLGMANSLAQRKQGKSPELIRIETETQRLEAMISNLLDLSRMQVDSHNKREIQPLQSLWETLLQDTQYEAEQVGKQLSFSDIPNRSLSCYPPLLMSALENIVRNAIYYGHSRIEVSMKELADQISIRVEDDGEGVPEDELEAIFRPFYRVSTARDSHSGGTGLGLSITESAIRQHSGSIRAGKSSLGGLLIEIHLPLQAKS